MGKGKYADVIDKLVVSFGEDPSYQQKIDETKKKILDLENSKPLPSEVVEEFVGEIVAMQTALNELFLHAVTERKASKIVRVYEDLRRLKETFSVQEKVTDLLIAAYEQLMVAQYQAEGTTSMTLNSGRAIRYNLEPHAQVTDKIANRLWAVKNNLENSLALPWQTINALTKQALLDGEPEPDGVEAIARPKITCTPSFKGDMI